MLLAEGAAAAGASDRDRERGVVDWRSFVAPGRYPSELITARACATSCSSLTGSGRRDEAALMTKVANGEVDAEWEKRAGNNDRVTMGTLVRHGVVERKPDGYRMRRPLPTRSARSPSGQSEVRGS